MAGSYAHVWASARAFGLHVITDIGAGADT
jgi:hypothetical protein